MIGAVPKELTVWEAVSTGHQQLHAASGTRWTAAFSVREWFAEHGSNPYRLTATDPKGNLRNTHAQSARHESLGLIPVLAD